MIGLGRNCLWMVGTDGGGEAKAAERRDAMGRVCDGWTTVGGQSRAEVDPSRAVIEGREHR
jgi:hypothetical protein